MKTVFVYEFCTALGLGRHPSDPAHSLWREGRAMRDAVADDLRAIPGITVRLLELESNATNEHAAFMQAVHESDCSLVIAPELDGELQRRCNWVRDSGASLLGCDAASMALTSDKLALGQHWRDRGVPTPRTISFAEQSIHPLPYPIVCKPIHGAGSTATIRIDDAPAWAAFCERESFEGFATDALLVQEWVAGRAASVAFLVGPYSTVALQPAYQHISNDGRFHYQGGETPILDAIARRVIEIGERAISAVNGLHGYVGVDVILGEDPNGKADYAIEINPRLTTSYVGLRQLADFNLAAAMLATCAGTPLTVHPWKPLQIRFGVDGRVAVLSRKI